MDNEKLIDIIQTVIASPSVPKLKTAWSTVDGIDHICAIVSAFPVVGGIISAEIQTIRKSVSMYREYEFFRKFSRFVWEIDDLDTNERDIFLKEVESASQDNAGNILMGMVDRLDNINKETILANLVKAMSKGNLDTQDFFRVSSILERIPYVDLESLERYRNPHTEFNSEFLFSTGAISLSTIGKNDNSYILSQLGEYLLIYGMNKDFDFIEEYRSTKIELDIATEEDVVKTIKKMEKEKRDRDEYEAYQGDLY